MSKYFKNRLAYPFNIQLFAAEGTEGGNGEGGQSGEGTEPGAGGQGSNTQAGQELSLTDLMKSNPQIQSQFDKLNAKAIETAKANWEKTLNNLVDDRLTEAERLKNMTAEQKAEYERQQAEAKLAQREADITRRELTAEAKITLADKGLPVSFAEHLNFESAETVNASIDSLKEAFEKEVKLRVAEQIKSNTVPGRGQGQSSHNDEAKERYRRIAGIKK